MVKKFLFISLVLSNLIFATSKEEIVNKIREILSSLPANTVSGIMIYDPLMQDTIFALNEYRPMTPASLTKLFTTSISLDIMGGEHKLSTRLYSDDLNFNDGTLNGNLFIKGFGNSLFSDIELQELVDDLVQKGIKSVSGNIIARRNLFAIIRIF